MITIRNLASAAAVIAGLQFAPAALQAQPASPEIIYNAPSWWITAVVQGKHSTLLTGNPDLDRRMNVWLVGFGQGLGERCHLAEGRTLQAVLNQHVTASPALRNPGDQGVKDGRRFAEINGCSSTDAAGARRTVANIGGSIIVADLPNRDTERRQADRRDERPTDRANSDREPANAREAVVINRSGARIDVLRMSATSDNDWGSDRLGRDVLPAGDGVRVPLAGACHYDLRVVYADSRYEERMNVDLCANPRVVFDGSSARLPRQASVSQPRGADGSSSSFAR
jgi:hypothetical protein